MAGHNEYYSCLLLRDPLRAFRPFFLQVSSDFHMQPKAPRIFQALGPPQNTSTYLDQCFPTLPTLPRISHSILEVSPPLPLYVITDKEHE